jgi:chaperonin GroEL
MSKEVKFSSEARCGLQDGLDTLANAVKATLGPKGRNAAIERTYGPPLITKDGVTVARAITLGDSVNNMGAELVKSVASSTNSVAGDGTTTATVLAQAIYTEGAKMVAAGHNPVLIKRGIDKAVTVVVDKLKDISAPVADDETVKNVAIISANNDVELGSLIGEVVSAVGNDGMISVEEATGAGTSVAYTEGITFDRGWITPTFATNLERLTVEFENPFILVYDGRIASTYEIMPILEAVSEHNRPLLIVSQTTESEALQTLVLNKARGTLSSCAVRAPGFGNIRRDMLGDIAAVCNAALLTDEAGNPLRDITLNDLGTARRVMVTRGTTTIVDGAGTAEDVKCRADTIKRQLSQDLETYEYASLRQRLSSLVGSIAVLKVGGISESEMKERKDRVEDAINAVKAAIEEGIVPGGGAALLHCESDLQSLKDSKGLITEEVVGVDVIARAIREPFIQILVNAGIEYHSYMEKIIGSNKMFSGFDALSGKPSNDMLKDGIIDPVKVVRTAIENAASASGTLLTTEVVIYESNQTNVD